MAGQHIRRQRRRPCHTTCAWALGALAAALGLLACAAAPRPATRSPRPLTAPRVPEDPLHEHWSTGPGGTGPDGTWTSTVFEARASFDELLPWWNVERSPEEPFLAEVRVAAGGGPWSPWLEAGRRGTIEGVATPGVVRFAEPDGRGGRVVVDVFRSADRWDRAQLRLRTAPGRSSLRIARAGLVATDTARLAARVWTASTEPWPAAVRVHVPARSQREEDEAIASRVCSPTSVAMALEAHGAPIPTAELAAQVHDPRHDLYGNWSRAVQTASEHGVPASLVRLSSWAGVARLLEGGVPLVASIAAEEGELRGAPYPRTDGHLLVVTGLAADGRVLVNDPAAPTPLTVPRVYLRSDLERCWFANGGVAYALGSPMEAEAQR